MDDKHSKYFKNNRSAWNKAAKVHKQHLKKLIEDFKSSRYPNIDKVQIMKLREVGIKNKKVVHLCCNNGRELLSLKRLGAKECVGFDISDEFISQAKELSRVTNIDCNFIRKNILKISNSFSGYFDFVYVTAGTLSWMPSLTRFFSVVSRLLDFGGYLLMYEFHPLLPIIDKKSKGNHFRINKSYFSQGYFSSKDAVTYYPGSYGRLPTQHLFRHTLSSVINSVCKSGLKIRSFDEYPHDVSLTFKNLEGGKVQIPMSYILTAKKV